MQLQTFFLRFFDFLYIFIVWILMWLNKDTHSTHYIRFMSSWMMRFSRLIKMIFYKINLCLSKVSPLNSLIALTINRIQSIENCSWCSKKVQRWRFSWSCSDELFTTNLFNAIPWLRVLCYRKNMYIWIAETEIQMLWM